MSFFRKIRKPKKGFLKIAFFSYPAEIALTGQAEVQAPQSTQESLIMYCPSPGSIAATGQTGAQAPQLTQLSEITCILVSLLGL